MFKKIKRNNNYSINENGEVRNDNTGYIKTPFVNKSNQYPTIDLYENGKSKKVTIHRLIAEAFIPNPENKLTVDHKDGNRQNNSIENLRWATYSEQNSRFRTIGVRSQTVIVKHHEEDRKKRGGGHNKWLNIINTIEFESVSKTAEYFNCTISNISLMLKKGTIGKRGSVRGYQFLFKDNKIQE